MKKLYILLITMFMVNIAMAQWTALSSGTAYGLNSICFTDANTGYVGGIDYDNQKGVIFKTINGGTNWTVLSSGTLNPLFSIYFVNSNTGYAVGSFGALLKKQPMQV